MTGDIGELLRAARVIPVLRGHDPHAVEAQATRFHEAGLRALEVTTTVPGWAELVTRFRLRWPDVAVAVGTVVTAAQAEQAAEVRADFLVSPYPAGSVREVAAARGVPFVEGGFSPGEVAAAAEHGPAKLFPAHLGGVRYLRDLLALMPDAQIMPTGGIALSEARSWLDAGAVAVGVGAALAEAPDLDAHARALLGTTHRGDGHEDR